MRGGRLRAGGPRASRAWLAVGVVVALVALVPASGCAIGLLQGGLVREAELSYCEAPVGFEDEVLSLSERSDVRVGADGAVVGFCCPMSAVAALEEVSAELGNRGWTLVESGSDRSATFVKREGRYRWLFVACTEVAGETSVVVTNDGYGKEDD